MRKFKGRVITPGTAKATAVVTHGGFNTLASMQMGLQFGDKQVKCSDQSNPEIYKLPLAGSALCKFFQTSIQQLRHRYGWQSGLLC